MVAVLGIALVVIVLALVLWGRIVLGGMFGEEGFTWTSRPSRALLIWWVVASLVVLSSAFWAPALLFPAEGGALDELLGADQRETRAGFRRMFRIIVVMAGGGQLALVGLRLVLARRRERAGS